MESETAFFYYIDYSILNNTPIIFLYGKTKDGSKIVIKDKQFKPYFLISLKKNDEVSIKNAIEKIKNLKYSPEAYVLSCEKVNKKVGLDTQPFIKVFVNIPSAIKKVKEVIKSSLNIYDKSFEKDILFVRRYLIDKKIYPLVFYEFIGTKEVKDNAEILELHDIKINDKKENTDYKEIGSLLKLLAIDIETNFSKNKNEHNTESIISVSLYSKDFEQVLMLKNNKSKLNYVTYCKDEKELLLLLKEQIKKYNPDIIFGYNSDDFDLPYISKRCKFNHVLFDVGWNSQVLKIVSGVMTSAKISGIAHIDLYKFIRNVIARSLNLSNLTLNEVASTILNEKKYDLDYTKIVEYWNNSKNLDEIAKYNLQDSKITYEIALKLLPQIFEMSRIVGIPPYSITRMSFSQFVEWYLIRKAVYENRLIPNRPGSDDLHDRMRNRYQGAFVFKPQPGIYENIVIFDFKSLYPTIIVTHNISPETYNVKTSEHNKYYVPSDNKNTKSMQSWFIKYPKGFISKYIEEIITKRTEIKSKMKKTKDSKLYQQLYARQISLKTIANSMYGYLGFYLSRWYSIDCAKAVTAFGRFYITNVISTAKNQGFKVIYSDTDSVFISLGQNKTKKEALSFLDKINENLPGIMKLDFEGFYLRGIFVSLKSNSSGAKKKYALVDENGDLLIKGFETIRRNWSVLGKEVQKNVIRIILVESNPKKAFDYVKSIIQKLKRGEIKKEKLVITTKLKKSIKNYDSFGPHVAAAIKLKEKGYDISPGSIISYIIKKGNGPIRDRIAILPEYKDGEYDMDYYINNQILPAVDRIFDVLGYSIDDLLSDTNQKDLSSYFK